MTQAVENSKSAKRRRAEYKAWVKTLPLDKQLDLIHTGQVLDTVNFSLIKEQMEKMRKESEHKMKALHILKRKVDYALRPRENKGLVKYRKDSKQKKLKSK